MQEELLDEVNAWVVDNKEWLFSGVGVMLLAWVGRIILKRVQAEPSQTIRSGEGSTNIQSGRDAIIGATKKSHDTE